MWTSRARTRSSVSARPRSSAAYPTRRARAARALRRRGAVPRRGGVLELEAPGRRAHALAQQRERPIRGPIEEVAGLGHPLVVLRARAPSRARRQAAAHLAPHVERILLHAEELELVREPH